MKEWIYWAWFASLKGISLLNKHKIIKQLKCVKSIYQLTDSEIEKIIGKSILVDKLNRDLESIACALEAWLESADNHSLIVWTDKSYPSLLKEIDGPPLCLYVKGSQKPLDEPQVGIVGSRKNSLYGKKVAFQFANNLGEKGITVTSGLALGIDGFAHEGALNAQAMTVAVMANGLERIYPARHKQLADRIIEGGGCLLSEFSLDMAPLKHHFPRRNRIISGLSQAVIVVEAERKSGSLITARLAMEQNREVFAVPGSVYSPTSLGCHDLIKMGVKPCSSIDDLIEDLYLPLKAKTLESNKAELKESDSPLLKFIAYDPMTIDEIINESRLTSEEVSAMLLTLELKGYVIRNSFGMFLRS